MDFVRSPSRSFHGSSGSGRRPPEIGSSPRVSDCHRHWSIPASSPGAWWPAGLPWEGTTVQRTTLDDVSQPDRHGVKTRVILTAVSGRETGRGERQGGGPGPGRAGRPSPAGRPPLVAADIHATSARRFHPSAAQPIAAAVSRELAIYDVKTRPSLATEAYHAASFVYALR